MFTADPPESVDPDEDDWLGPSWMWVPGDLDTNSDTDNNR